MMAADGASGVQMAAIGSQQAQLLCMNFTYVLRAICGKFCFHREAGGAWS